MGRSQRLEMKRRILVEKFSECTKTSVVIFSDNGLCMPSKAIHHIVHGVEVCERSPACKIFDIPSVNPPSDNPNNGQIQMPRSRGCLRFRRPSSVQAIRHQAHNIFLDMKPLVASYSMIASYSSSEAIAVAGMRCFIR